MFFSILHITAFVTNMIFQDQEDGLIRFTICSLCILTFFVILVIPHFGFEGGTLVLFALVHFYFL